MPEDNTQPDTLEHWRARALAQAEQIKAHDETIRALIADSYGTTYLRACPTHWPTIRDLGAEIDQIQTAEHRADDARGIYATSVVYLEFLRPDQVARITPGNLGDWAKRVIAQADEALDPSPPVPEVAAPAMPSPKPEGWVDPRTTVEYWRTIAKRQADTIAGHPAVLAKYTAERDHAREYWSRCEVHERHLAELHEGLARDTVRLARTGKALEILASWFPTLLDGVPADLTRQAKRVGARAHRAWNP